METKATDFQSIIIKVASPEKILSWSRGEVTKPETINYRTQRAEKDGLFDERIFGPEKDYECYCGKYRRVRYKGIICDKCGVEVTRSIVRRERMGHISLATPAAHIWFLRGVPSRIGILFDLTLPDLEKVIYFASYITIKVDEESRAQKLNELDKEYKQKSKTVTKRDETARLKDAYERTKSELENLRPLQILSEVEYHRLSLKYGDLFEAGIGAEALYRLAKDMDLGRTKAELEKDFEESDLPAKRKIARRLALIKNMLRSGIRPEWMFLTVIPVTPPALRPMVPLDGGRHATSDVNDLYRRVINRNNRLKKLLELSAPEVIVRNEKRMLQEAVDALFDNSIRRGHSAATSQAQKRALKSLADTLRGKQGRFRQNLLGKRVDYSGRSVIVVGPELKLHQCGLPKHMALELFRPFVISKLIINGLAHNIRGANRMIDEPTPDVWSALEEVIKNKLVLLNRAPTLHRLGIQAFQPVLIEGNAIQVHPLVCPAYNADFDGDQMAVHVPLGIEAQKEAEELMWSVRNLTKPGSGEPIVNPTQDMVLGIYWLTKILPQAKGEAGIFSSPNEAILAHEFGVVDLRAKVKVAVTDTPKYKSAVGEGGGFFETSVGRLLFNSALPDNFSFINREIGKKDLGQIVSLLIAHYGREALPAILDKIKNFGFKYATVSGVSWGMNDLIVPEEKQDIINEALVQEKKVYEQFNDGLLTHEDRYKKIVEIWNGVMQRVNELVPKTLDSLGPVHTMVSSAARGTWAQIAQMAGMKGLVRNPAGRVIELPIISNYKEGLGVLEYFIATHGARKGTADTALKTSVAGHLTRRLVDVAQDMIVSIKDCKDSSGLKVTRKDADDYGRGFANRVFGRVLAREAKDKHGKTLFKKGHLLTFDDADLMERSEIDEAYLRSPLTCKAPRGICQQCYGYDLGTNEIVKLGEAVGIVAAQAIGEPGTQLTMRTFHTGGVATGGDITLGLPRVEELFEMRSPANPAILSECNGTVIDITEDGRDKILKILIDQAQKTKIKKEETKEYRVPFGRAMIVEKGSNVKRGSKLSDGSVDLRELFDLAGETEAQNYIINGISYIYASQGSSTNFKHMELIVRQIFSRVKITDSGDTNLSVGAVTERAELVEENKKLGKKGNPAKAETHPLGITRASLASSSFLAAASFQETTRVLISAALEGKEDKLRGLKENVIIGRIIPAGTGFHQDTGVSDSQEEVFEEEAVEAEAEK
ncbi:MAG: DNA-directed RNA polymerase subunit beta' [Candidatus Niyogibacteria bacterium RIFCSPLOWO2_01_FULL_45_48]|uniref:DNA-directed RNA polymerase subunit beta' n=3 Tax=Parcubacteria group TaxID=1794811 RepID=A0A1G2EYD0_9BACT|nr:MAG: DNA-directed RNA polymerase subunit beta' [Candidatus Niyogibacteria bacterium RIFCSPHIGHO2_01_FULL_45_28]OGZ30361.1 MAG: DNA-directed RNA polymerase subunit beta' [Candidatus Niyogibacteria bacterium RIFCSPLOWO2_02_FULL_45_13]OGZ30398.1 MAG: DNA-directed RNA polymerase subunit beta' [Candidatus Niyogibacteria bacterium RIFCSPLOWO2_01_FULL_45_48]OHA68009.1 MAG: DNA-directed RNA polymerase subunit beta' [Candidatus Wildermuthbacteria bacterium RIFCSPHIGHO2_02_FULL_47_17]